MDTQTIEGRKILRNRVLSALKNREGKFTAVDIAEQIGYPTQIGVYDTCPNVRRILTQLCKEQVLYQWITGNGRNPFGITNVPKYDVNYLRRDSCLAKTLFERRGKYFKGYRFL